MPFNKLIILRRFVFPLLATITAVNAESTILVSQTGGGLVKVEMNDMKSCEIESTKYKKQNLLPQKLYLLIA